MASAVIISGTLPSIDPTYEKIIKEDLREIFEKAAKVFVRVASSRIPKLSNQARGTLLDLADFVGTQLASGPAPRSTRAPRGQSASTGRAQSFYQLDFNRFEWGTTVPYFEKHDDEEWRAIEAATEAFITEVEFLLDQDFGPDDLIIGVSL